MAKIMIAACGIDCEACPSYVATVKNDQAALEALAVQWAKEYGGSFSASSVRCLGCTSSGGVQIGHCSECGVRLCAVGKGYTTCAECQDYSCEKLTAFNGQIPGAKENLDRLSIVDPKGWTRT
jgi:hypothetical protein